MLVARKVVQRELEGVKMLAETAPMLVTFFGSMGCWISFRLSVAGWSGVCLSSSLCRKRELVVPWQVVGEERLEVQQLLLEESADLRLNYLVVLAALALHRPKMIRHPGSQAATVVAVPFLELPRSLASV